MLPTVFQCDRYGSRSVMDCGEISLEAMCKPTVALMLLDTRKILRTYAVAVSTGFLQGYDSARCHVAMLSVSG